MARIACIFSVEVFKTVERPLNSWGKVPFGLSVIAACLEEAGHRVRCWVICPATPLDIVAKQMLEDFGCDMVAATSVTTQYPLIAQMCHTIKLHDQAMPILLGGVHSSLNPEAAFQNPDVDAICIGEGEKATLAFAAAIDRKEQPREIPGLWIKRLELNSGDHAANREIISQTPPLPFATDLDELPFINLLHWSQWVNESDRSFRVVIGRGCPFGCTYCSNHALKKLTTGKYVRFRSPNHVMREIHGLVARYPDLTELYLEIETIGSSPTFAIELCDRLAAFNAARPKPLEFRANLAVTSALVHNTERMNELLSAFQRANLTVLNVGLESGSERIRKEILNRPHYTNADLITFCKTAKQRGVSVVLYILMGLPTETSADVLETAAIARACEPLAIYESIFYPYPGTKLYHLAADMHLFDPETVDTKAERTRAYLNLEGFPQWRIWFEYVFITWRVFHGRWSSVRVFRNMAYKALTMTPTLLSAALKVRTLLTPRTAP